MARIYGATRKPKDPQIPTKAGFSSPGGFKKGK